MEIVTRAQWGARPPRRRLTMALPSRELWLHHTAGTERGISGMRRIQNQHMDVKGWDDIAYSVVIDPADLTVYEGRGPGVIGGHTFGHNSISHAICVMGDYDVLRPSDLLIAKIAEVVKHGNSQGWWPAALSGGHRDVRATQCPGNHLYPQIARINMLAHASGGPTMPTPDEFVEITKQVQTSLVRLGYDIGDFGPNKDGVDGDWGQVTSAVLSRAFNDIARLKAQPPTDPAVVAKARQFDALAAALRPLLGG